MTIEIYCDGGLLGHRNPSPEGVYWTVWADPPGHVVKRKKSTRHHTNNDAEWLALHAALLCVLDNYEGEAVTIHSDSQLIVNQFNGEWRANEDSMRRARDFCRKLADELEPRPVVIWCPRKEMVRRVGH